MQAVAAQSRRRSHVDGTVSGSVKPGRGLQGSLQMGYSADGADCQSQCVSGSLRCELRVVVRQVAPIRARQANGTRWDPAMTEAENLAQDCSSESPS
jgi:hypothetical protein